MEVFWSSSVCLNLFLEKICIQGPRLLCQDYFFYFPQEFTFIECVIYKIVILKKKSQQTINKATLTLANKIIFHRSALSSSSSYFKKILRKELRYIYLQVIKCSFVETCNRMFTYLKLAELNTSYNSKTLQEKRTGFRASGLKDDTCMVFVIACVS